MRSATVDNRSCGPTTGLIRLPLADGPIDSMDYPDTLSYTSAEHPGLHRKKWGRGYTYLDESGNKIKSGSTLQRIKELAIPHAWRNVWISALPNGHLQATGIEGKNRKQYLYH